MSRGIPIIGFQQQPPSSKQINLMLPNQLQKPPSSSYQSNLFLNPNDKTNRYIPQSQSSNQQQLLGGLYTPTRDRRKIQNNSLSVPINGNDVVNMAYQSSLQKPTLSLSRNGSSMNQQSSSSNIKESTKSYQPYQIQHLNKSLSPQRQIHLPSIHQSAYSYQPNFAPINKSVILPPSGYDNNPQQQVMRTNPVLKESSLSSMKDHLEQQQQMLLSLAQEGAHQNMDQEYERNKELKRKLKSMKLKKNELHKSLVAIMTQKQNVPKDSEQKDKTVKVLNKKIDSLQDAMRKQNEDIPRLLMQNQMYRPPPQQQPINPYLHQFLPKQENPGNEEQPKNNNPYDQQKAMQDMMNQERIQNELNKQKQMLDEIYNEIKNKPKEERKKMDDYERQPIQQQPPIAEKIQMVEQKQQMAQKVAQMPRFNWVKKGSKRYLKAVVTAIMAWLKVRRNVSGGSHKFKQRNNAVRELDNGLNLYSDIAKTWIIKAIKHPLLSILNDPTLNLNIIDQNIEYYELQNRLMKVNARIKGVFKDIFDNTNAQSMPLPLVNFLNSLVKKGQFVPNNFLSEFEMNKLDLDELGALKHLNNQQVQMILGSFILVKILVGKILSNPSSLQSLLGQSIAGNPNQVRMMKFNFKILASLAYYTVLEYLELLLRVKGYSEDMIWTSGLRNIIFKHQELRLFYKEENYRFRCDLFGIIEDQLKAMLNLVFKSDSLSNPRF